jgi:hypothetical protein
MEGRVARRLPRLLTVSRAARDEIVGELGVLVYVSEEDARVVGRQDPQMELADAVLWTGKVKPNRPFAHEVRAAPS